MKGNYFMRKSLLVDRDLLHLENVLFDLDNYHFDSDIIKCLNDLKLLVDSKLYNDKVMKNGGTLSNKILLQFNVDV